MDNIKFGLPDFKVDNCDVGTVQDLDWVWLNKWIINILTGCKVKR